MRFSTLSFALLPLLALAEETTTLTSTATKTRTVTLSEVVASVTSTYGMNTTSTFAYATGTVGTASTTFATSTPSSPPENFMGAATNLNGMYAGSAGVLVMIAAALL